MIQKTPGVCGGDACIGRTRIPVWGLVSLRNQGASDGRILVGHTPPERLQPFCFILLIAAQQL